MGKSVNTTGITGRQPQSDLPKLVLFISICLCTFIMVYGFAKAANENKKSISHPKINKEKLLGWIILGILGLLIAIISAMYYLRLMFSS